MKRLFLILLLILTLCAMSSCAPVEAELKDSFEIPIGISGTLDCSADLSRSGDSLTLTFTSPPSVAGLSYAYANGELTTSCDGLSCITDKSSLPDTALPHILYTAVTDIKNAAYLRSNEEGDVFQLSGATITLREGLPVRIDVTDPAFSILAG